MYRPVRTTRRSFLRASAAALIGQSMARLAMAQNTRLPERGELLLRNGHVLTMDRSLGNFERADVHIRDGRIVDVGPGLQAPRAEVLEAADMIVSPGFVETHWHIWTTLLRSMSGDSAEFGYFPTSRGIGAFYEARDMYFAGRLALAEATFGGITCVHDWCHNVRAPEYAREALSALLASGLRGRFSYGSPAGASNDEPLDLGDIAQLRERWDDFSDGGRLQLGLAWRGAGTAASREDYARARDLDLPISVHVNNFQSAAGGIAAIAEAGMLGPHVQLIHAIWSTPAEIAAVAESGASLSLSPFTELRIGFGFPMTAEYLAAGVPIGLSVDTPALSGNADMFSIMKAIQNVANARALDEFALPASRVLELATIEGARSMGIETQTGSLTPGKCADVIMIDTRHVNLGVFTDPAHMLVEAAQPSNVDTVIVDGRILKRAGRLTSLDTAEVVAEARNASVAVRGRADWW